MKRIVKLLIGAVFGLSIATAAQAQSDYPTKPIRLVVPFSPGGGSDALARLVAQEAASTLGQPILVENRPGAGGNLGTAEVARAAPDGYTIVLGVIGPITVNVSLFASLPYDPEKDLAPITQAAAVTNILVVPKSLGVNTLKELIDLGKSRADTQPLKFGTGGPGTAAHLAGETLSMMAGLKATHIPYQGSGPAIVDAIAGRIDFIFDNMPSALPHVQSGKLVALAVPTAARSPAVPNIPTVAESGLEGFNVTNWYGFLAPAGTPKPIIDKLNAAIVKALNDSKNKEKLAAQALEVIGNSPEEFAAVIHSEIPKWREIIVKSGAKIR